MSTRAQHGDGRVPPRSKPPVSFRVCADLAGQDGLVVEEPPQVLAHRLGRGIPLLRVLLDRLQEDRLQVARNASVERPGLRRLLGLDPLDQLQPVGRTERGAQCHELVQGQTEGVDVGAGVPLPAEPLGGHVAESPEDVTALGQPLVFALGQAEIGDPDHACVVEQQIRRLDVAVDDPAGHGSRPAPAPHLGQSTCRGAEERPPAVARQAAASWRISAPPGSTAEVGRGRAASGTDSSGLAAPRRRPRAPRGRAFLPAASPAEAGPSSASDTAPSAASRPVRSNLATRPSLDSIGPADASTSALPSPTATRRRDSRSLASSLMTWSSPWPRMNCMA